MEDKGEYCPLCGAHEAEHNEGKADDKTIKNWNVEIQELYNKMHELFFGY